MLPLLSSLVLYSLLAVTSVASPVALDDVPALIDPRQGPQPTMNPQPTPTVLPSAGNPCAGNTATTRSQWCGLSVDTDYTEVVPNTGVTREYWLELTDMTLAPDGISRTVMAVNGSIPGPTIIANWGDNVVVHVINSLHTSNNGSSIHWHGIRQNYTNQADGVVSVTQCPTAPGQTTTYKWRATQYGTTWYHSHFALQAWEGVYGGVIINGPATANYDVDLGTMSLSDWDHLTADSLYSAAQTTGPPSLANGLINGTNVYGTSGSRHTTSFEAGKSYRIRLVNVAIDTHFKFSIDNHTMTVIAADLVPIQPFTATVLNIGIGQRYDIVVQADQATTADTFWLRAVPQAACSDVLTASNVMGIVSYTGDFSDPTTAGHTYTDGCDDETENIVPRVSKTVGAATIETSEEVSFAIVDTNLFKWTLNSTTLLVDWAAPTVSHVLSGNTTFNQQASVITLAEKDVWFYLAIDTQLAFAHPVHLHGHDFFILAQGTGTYDSSVTLNLVNPPRRDVAMLPPSGHLVMAFQTDNPGVWLMHCHIGWHTLEGFGLQFVERADEIPGITDAAVMQDTCDAWSSFQTSNNILQADSGI